jgi:hypothetical protein
MAIPYDWTVSHLFKNHRITTTLPEIEDYLDLDEPSLNKDEVAEWISQTSFLPEPVKNISVQDGLICGKCDFACFATQTMKNHYSDDRFPDHQGLRRQDWVIGGLSILCRPYRV